MVSLARPCLVFGWVSLFLVVVGGFTISTAETLTSKETCSNAALEKPKDLKEAETCILRFLKTDTKFPKGNDFLVQGWRWHTMSLVREADRLQKLAEFTCDMHGGKEDCLAEKFSQLKCATEYVVGFNMQALHKIEKDLFFPWVRERTLRAVSESDVCTAIDILLDQLESDRRRIEAIGASLNKKVALLASADSSTPSDVFLRTINDVAAKAMAIKENTQSMLKREELFLIPIVAKTIDQAEQRSFNNKVIIRLGVLDSRLHLVGMHEAIQDDEKEKQLFRATIPSIPQKMIPRWKRLLYEPRAGYLNQQRLRRN